MVTKKKLRTALVVIMALAFVLLSPGGALANGGWKNPSANATDTGGPFTEPEKAYSDGSGEASVGCGDQSASHRYYDYNLGVPDCAIINGIEVRLDWWLSDTGGTNTMSVELSWGGGTSWTTTVNEDSTETTTEHTVILGGPADTWGRTWTAAELNNTNFRVRVTCTNTGG